MSPPTGSGWRPSLPGSTGTRWTPRWSDCPGWPASWSATRRRFRRNRQRTASYLLSPRSETGKDSWMRKHFLLSLPCCGTTSTVSPASEPAVPPPRDSSGKRTLTASSTPEDRRKLYDSDELYAFFQQLSPERILRSAKGHRGTAVAPDDRRTERNIPAGVAAGGSRLLRFADRLPPWRVPSAG